MSEERLAYAGDRPDEQNVFIRDESPHDYFAQIPNLVDDLNLTPYAFRLYGHLRRVAGENGKCWQNTATLAKACRMSEGSVSAAKKELQSTYPPLIRISDKTKENGGVYHEITVTDVWQINHDFFTLDGIHVVKSAERDSPSEPPRSPSETKKNTLKKTPEPGVIQEIEKQANRKVDAILDQERLAVGKVSYPKREALPEPIRELIDAFVDATNIRPLAKETMGWLMAGQDWLNLGASAADVRGALEYAKGKFAIMTPHSLTNTLRAYRAGQFNPVVEEKGHWL